MRYLMFLIITLVLFACKKEDTFDSTPEYLSIVGEWGNIEGLDEILIFIGKNGVIQVVRNDTRSKLIKTDYINYNDSQLDAYNSIWDFFGCVEYGDKKNNSIILFSTVNRDTLLSYVGATDYYSGTSNKISFIRK